MHDVSFENLLGIALIAAAGPLLLGFTPRLRVPAIVLEIVAGIIVGPSGLGWVEVDVVVSILATIGLAFLLFLAGLEIDVRRLRGRLLVIAVAGFAITWVLALAAGHGFELVGLVSDPVLLAITLSATGLGLVVPVLKDARQLASDIGQTTVAAASIADFGAVILLSLLFSMTHGSTGSRAALLSVFAVLVVATAAAVSRSAMSRRLGAVLVMLQDTTAEIRVRFTVLLLVAFVVLAETFGLESILGAFAAGAALGVIDRDTRSHPRLRTKLDAIGYGFLIPVFFVASGVRLELSALLDEPSALTRVPLFLVALFLVRGTPALLYLRTFGRRASTAAALLQATSLPFIVAATQIGTELGALSAVNAAALVSAGLLSVLAFPPIALALMRRHMPPAPTRTDAAQADAAQLATK